MNEVVSISYKSGHVFHVLFDNGLAGDVDLSEYIHKWPIFAPLREIDFLKKARIEGGGISWPNGADIAPERLYEKLVDTLSSQNCPIKNQPSAGLHPETL